VEDRMVVANVGRYPSQPFRAPEKKFTIILRQLIIRRIV